MSRPENLTPDEAEIWQRMELHGEELVRDMGAGHGARKRQTVYGQQRKRDELYDGADAAAGGGAALTYEEYRRELNEALEKADWMNPRDKNGPAYRILARAARDKALPLAQWQKLHDEYYERTKR